MILGQTDLSKEHLKKFFKGYSTHQELKICGCTLRQLIPRPSYDQNAKKYRFKGTPSPEGRRSIKNNFFRQKIFLQCLPCPKTSKYTVATGQDAIVKKIKSKQ